jgi:hypothetical protein
MNFTILREQPAGADQARRVEDVPRPRVVDFQKRPGLDEDAEVFRPARVLVSVLIRNWQREVLDQFLRRLVHGRGVREFGEDDQSHVEERFIAADGKVDHLEHPPHSARDRLAVARVGRVDLAAGGVVAVGRCGHGCGSS